MNSDKRVPLGEICSYEINPPLPGGYKYGAKAVIDKTKRESILHEHYGKTEQEARDKAQEELEEYLAKEDR